jgi:hypothetical protein
MTGSKKAHEETSREQKIWIPAYFSCAFSYIQACLP